MCAAPLGQPMQVLGGCSVSLATAFENGRRIVPPGDCPSTGVTAKMGRERPRPRLAPAAPRPFSGVAHAPHVGVDDVLGRVSDARWNCASEEAAVSRKTVVGNQPNCAPQSGRIPAQKSHPIRVAPVLDFPEALGRVKASFADAHRVRGLDPPGALPSGLQLPERRQDQQRDSV
jgi:hypothetical protein